MKAKVKKAKRYIVRYLWKSTDGMTARRSGVDSTGKRIYTQFIPEGDKLHKRKVKNAR